MNATKRKFNSLVQGMNPRPRSRPSSMDRNDTTSSTDQVISENRMSCSNLSSVTIACDPANDTKVNATDNTLLDPTADPKRRRIIGASSITAVDKHSNSTTTYSNIVLKKFVPPQDTKQSPRYCPGDREQLIHRLATFQELTDWTPKPDRVNEVEWAKRGWICKGKERVQCTLCHRELVVKLNRKVVDGKEVSVLVASDIEDRIVDKYVEMMDTSHQEDCLWRKRRCDDSLLRIPTSEASAAIAALKTRYQQLLERKPFLPYMFNLRMPPELDLDLILPTLPPDFFLASTSNTIRPGIREPNMSALVLALTGWQELINSRTNQPVPNSASCHTCLRRLGLWMFRSKEVDPVTNAVVVPAPMDHLDPLREHRPFCPWRNGNAQMPTAASSATAASRQTNASLDQAVQPVWRVLLTTLKNDAYLRNRDKKKTSEDVALLPNKRPKSFLSGKSSTIASALRDIAGDKDDHDLKRSPTKDKASKAKSKGNTSVPGTPAKDKSSFAGMSVSQAQAGTPGTPGTPGSPLVGDHADMTDIGVNDDDDVDVENPAAKDKERWARLRRVKSLFGSSKDWRRGGKSKSRPVTPGGGKDSVPVTPTVASVNGCGDTAPASDQAV